MLYILRFFSPYFGPLRMLGSHLVLMCLGSLVAALVVWLFLPKLTNKMPLDRGKELVKDSEAAKGKPTGAGKWMIILMLPVLFLVLPLSSTGISSGSSLAQLSASVTEILKSPSEWFKLVNQQWGVVLCLVLAMMTGFADDSAAVPWGRVKKGLWDAVIALLTTFFLCMGKDTELWWPITKTITSCPPWLFIPAGAALLWFSMNATNCSDGVDGLAGSLTLISLYALTAFLYGVVGHEIIAKYLLVPHHPEGARWAILTATVAGGIAGYLWHNAAPSLLLMGDAGSRPLGLLVGVAVLVSGNPFLILVVSFVVLLNGGTGLLKILLLKFCRFLGFDIRTPEALKASGDQTPVKQHLLVRLLNKIRFPLHDHFRQNKKWTGSQVLMRFVLLQGFFMPILFLIIVKVR